MNAICLITLRPNEIWCDFLNAFSGSIYKLFVVVDDNTFDLSAFKDKFENICFIQIENVQCKLTGFVDTSFTLNKLISGWDKALCYFATLEEQEQPPFIWFLEDDVYLCNESTIANIDAAHTDEDLLSNKCCTNIDGNKNSWHWKRIQINHPPPYHCGMMCVVRISRKMLQCIREYADNNGTLYFLEALFPTIAAKNNLKHLDALHAFTNVTYRNTFADEDINDCDFFHPVKDMRRHLFLRQLQTQK